MDHIILFIIILLAFSGGYLLAIDRNTYNKNVKTLKKGKKWIIEEIKKDPYVGAVRRPNAERLDRIRNPKKYEGVDETKRVLDETLKK